MNFSFISLYRGARGDRRHVAFGSVPPATPPPPLVGEPPPAAHLSARMPLGRPRPPRRGDALALRRRAVALGGTDRRRAGVAGGSRRVSGPSPAPRDSASTSSRSATQRRRRAGRGGEQGSGRGGEPSPVPTARATGSLHAAPGAAPIGRRACPPHHEDPASGPPTLRPAALAGGGLTERLRGTAEGNAERRRQGARDDRFHEPSRGAACRHRRLWPRRRRHRRARPGGDARRLTKTGGDDDRVMERGRCVDGGVGASVAGGSVVSALSSWGGVGCRSAEVADEAEWAGAAGGRFGTMVWAEVEKGAEAESVLVVVSMMFRESRKSKQFKRSCQ